jgi:hypothetical protein
MMRWNLNVYLICISIMAKNVEHFMYLLAICTSFENHVFYSFAHLLIWLFVLLVFNFWDSLYFLDINPLSDELLAKIFFHSVGCHLILVIVSLAVQKLFNSIQSHLSILASISWAIGVLFRKLLSKSISSSAYFFYTAFKVAGPTSRLLIHYELIFVHGER